MKTMTLSALTLAVALCSAQANAAAYSAAQVISAGQSYTFESGEIAAGASGISDFFTFTLAPGVSGANFLFNIALPDAATESFAVSYLGNELFVSDHSVYKDYSYFDGEEMVTIIGLDKSEYTFSLTGVGSGVQTIEIAARFATPFIADHNYSLTVSAVPEPGSLALLFAGLGLMGVIARRKAKSN